MTVYISYAPPPPLAHMDTPPPHPLHTCTHTYPTHSTHTHTHTPRPLHIHTHTGAVHTRARDSQELHELIRSIRQLCSTVNIRDCTVVTPRSEVYGSDSVCVCVCVCIDYVLLYTASQGSMKCK